MPSEGPARSRGAMERRSQNYPSAISTAPVFSFFFGFWAEWPGLDRGVGGRGSCYGHPLTFDMLCMVIVVVGAYYITEKFRWHCGGAPGKSWARAKVIFACAFHTYCL